MTEVHNVAMFFEMILAVLTFTGLGAGALIVLGYEISTKRRA
jgi:hypothetical protein